MVVSDHYSIILMESNSLSFQPLSSHRPARKRVASSYAQHIRKFIKSSSQICEHPKDETSVSAERPSPKQQHIPLLTQKLNKNELPCILPVGRQLMISIILPSEKKSKNLKKEVPIQEKSQAPKRLLDIFQNVLKNFDKPRKQVQRQQEQNGSRTIHKNQQLDRKNELKKDQEKFKGYYEKFKIYNQKLAQISANTLLL